MKRKILSILSAAALFLMLLPVGLLSVSAGEPVPGMYEDFENITVEQAQGFFKFESGDAVTASLSSNKGVNGSKALDIAFTLGSDGQGWVKQKHKITEVKGDLLMVTFTLSAKTGMKFGFRNDGAWMPEECFCAGYGGAYEDLEAGTYTRILSLEGIQNISALEIVLDIGDGTTGGEHHIYFDEFRFCEIEKYVDAQYMTEADAQEFVKKVSGAAPQATIQNGNLVVSYDGPDGWSRWALGGEGFQKKGLGMFIDFSIANNANQNNGLRVAIMDNDAGAWNQEFTNGLLTAGTYSSFMLWDNTTSSRFRLDFSFDDWGARNTVTLFNCFYVVPLSEDTTPGDTTALQAALDTYKTTYDSTGDKYTPESFQAFKAEYNAADAMVKSGSATATQLAEQLKKLHYAFNSLRPLSFDYSKLEQALAGADTFFDGNPEDTYTAHSLGLIQKAYNKAEAMLAGQTATTQKQIDDMASSLNTAVSSAYPIVKDTPVYPKDDADTLLTDFEDYDSFGDIPQGGGSTDGWQFESTPFITRLDKTNPISGQKSLKITWDGLDNDTWGAYRLFMYNSGQYPMRNQAISFTIKVAFDYALTAVIYDLDTTTTYSCVVNIPASDQPQTVTLPFNQFRNSVESSYGYGEPMTAAQFAKFINQWNCFKLQLDRLSGLPESGEMWLDCFKLTANEGPQEAAPPPDGQGGDSSDSSDSSGGESSGEIIEPDDPQPDESDGFHVLQNFEDMTAEKLAELFGTPSAGTLSLDTSKKLFGSNSMKLTYDFTGDSKSASIQAAFPGLRGDGLYLMVLSANDAVLTLKLSDGTLWTEYQVPVKGSDKEQMVFVNFVDTVSGKGTFDELNKAKITLSMTLSSEKAIAGDIYFDNIGYFLYDEMLENKTPDGGDSSNGGNSSNGGDSSNGGSTSSGGSDSSPSTGEAGGLLAVAGLGVLAAMAAIVVSRRKKTENISSDM